MRNGDTVNDGEEPDDDVPPPEYEKVKDAAQGGGVLTKKHELPELDRQNGATLGRILGRGSIGEAEEGSDGRMYAKIRIPEDELVFEPGILVLPHGGELEIEITNDDNNTPARSFRAMVTTSSSGW